jgi:hypothetical protein
MKETKPMKLIATAGLLLASTIAADAYTLETAHWKPGTVSFYVDLGTFNNVAARELAVWDQYTGKTFLTTTKNSATNGEVWFMDGRNSIEFASAVGWNLPGNILGVCSFNDLNSAGVNTGIMQESDILINPNYNWDNGYYDIGRVLLHEIGHAIGLGHSEFGDAIMGPYIYPGDTRSELTADDIAGATFLYGPGSRNVPDSGSTAALLTFAIGALIAIRKQQTN